MENKKKLPGEFYGILIWSIIFWLFLFFCFRHYDNGIILSSIMSTLLTFLANIFSFSQVTR